MGVLRAPFLVDAHVHLHEAFDVRRFLVAAMRNTRREGAKLGLSNPVGVLLFTESAGVDRYDELLSLENSPDDAAWTIEPRDGGDSLVIRAGEETLVLIGGRQIATAGGLEVLSLTSREPFPDGRPFLETLRAVQTVGGIAVVPWGFGKWWLGRGRTVLETIESAGPGSLYLGDNGGRSSIGGNPHLFQKALERGIGILPGSDPLPFASHESRAGSYGFLLRDGALEEPARELRSLLNRGIRPEAFGERMALGAFVAAQVRMQLRKRGSTSGSN